MNFKSIFYPVVIFFCLFLIIKNVLKKVNYNLKKDDIKVLYVLKEYNKGIYFILTLTGLMIIPRVLYFIDMIKNDVFDINEAVTAAILPIIIIVLFLSLYKKTKITTLGIIKKNNLIRWEDIKKISYLKPDAKGKQNIRINYKYNNKNLYTDLVFKKFDKEIDKFRETATEYLYYNKNLQLK